MYIFRNKVFFIFFMIFDFCGYVLTSPLKLFKQKSQPSFPKHILAIRLDHIGDVISSMPVFENLKIRFPESKVTFLVSDWAKDIVKNNPYIDQVISFDTPWFRRSKKSTFGCFGFLQLVMQLRKHGFDIGIDLRGDFRHILLMALAGVKYRVGYGITGGGFLLHKKAEYRRGVDAVEHNLDLLRSLGLQIVAVKPKIYISDRDKRLVQELLVKFGLDKSQPFVVMHTAAGYPSKNWLEARFANLINIFTKQYGMKVVLVGSENDQRANDRVIALSEVGSVVNAAGMTSLAVLAGLIQEARLFIGIDSGPSHISSAEHKPTVILYSATNKASEWLPRGENTIAIQKDVTCSGCQKLFCDHNKCMELISVEDVLGAADSVLGGGLKIRK